MTDPICIREAEVLDALSMGRWAAGGEDELHAHAAGCRSCRELIAVAGAVLDDRSALMKSAQIPASGLVWWRATMRARREAARRALRMARIVQVALVAFALSTALGWLGIQISPTDLRIALAAMHGFALPLLAFVAWMILAPVAVYFVVTEE